MPFTADDIVVLKGLEAVRRRPNLYVGSDGQEGLNRLLTAAIGNAVGEVSEGHASKVLIELKEHSIVVDDDGRGIPIDEASPGVSVIELVFTTFGGCKCGCGKPPGHREGDNCVPLVVVNALSSRLEVETIRDGVLHSMAFEEGTITRALSSHGTTQERGTRIAFEPDRSIWGDESVIDTPWLREYVAKLVASGFDVTVEPGV